MRKPIEVFNNDEQLHQTMLEWKSLLMLDSWTIATMLCSLNELKDGELTLVGKNEVDYINKGAVIYIVDGKDIPLTAERFCAEETLVHELLHCKYNVLSDNDCSYEGAMLDAHQHQLLEEMAKSLMMARYDLPFSYWKNPFWDTEFSHEYTEE